MTTLVTVHRRSSEDDSWRSESTALIDCASTHLYLHSAGQPPQLSEVTVLDHGNNGQVIFINKDRHQPSKEGGLIITYPSGARFNIGDLYNDGNKLQQVEVAHLPGVRINNLVHPVRKRRKQ